MSRTKTFQEEGKLHFLILIEEEEEGVVRIEYHVVKPPLEKTISLILPADISFDDFRRSWEAQGSKWFSLVEGEEPLYFGTRVIWLPRDRCLAWHLFHPFKVPVDSLSIQELGLAQWEALLAAHRG